MTSRSVSPAKASSSTSSKVSCAFCFSIMSQCRCSPYKVTAHRLQTKDVPQLEHEIRQSHGRIDELTDMLHAATQPLIAQVADLTSHVKNLNFEITKRDQRIAALQIKLQEQRREQEEDQAHISDLKRSNEKLTLNIQRLVESDICQASKRGDFDLVSLWLTLGCDVNKKDHEQWTSLHWASGSGRCDIAELLVEHKADIHAKDDDRWEPLHWAASGGHLKLVNLLLSSNADVNARCKNLHTPMHWATTMGHKDVAHILQQHGGTLMEDQSVLNSRLHPRLKEHESSNCSGIGWSKFEVCPAGFVRLSFLLPNDAKCEVLAEDSGPQFEISTNEGRSWSPLSCENHDHESWGGRLYLSDPIIITRDILRCVWRGQVFGPRSLPTERL